MQLKERGAKESVRAYALRVIRDDIIHLGLEPGSMVSENELAAKLGTSRGPVREALIELCKVRIVEIYPQQGSRISMIDYSLVDEACFMRETLEKAVTERCCVRGIGKESLEALRENVRLQEFYQADEKIDKLWELDDEFHRLLFLNAGVLQVHVLMSSMLIHFDRVRAIALRAGRKIKTVEDHGRILKAITSGDAERAKNLMHEHLTSYLVDKQTVFSRYPQYVKE